MCFRVNFGTSCCVTDAQYASEVSLIHSSSYLCGLFLFWLKMTTRLSHSRSRVGCFCQASHDCINNSEHSDLSLRSRSCKTMFLHECIRIDEVHQVWAWASTQISRLLRMCVHLKLFMTFQCVCPWFQRWFQNYTSLHRSRNNLTTRAACLWVCEIVRLWGISVRIKLKGEELQ